MSAQQLKVTIFPPLRVHSTKPLSATETQPLISSYLSKSLKKPCLHPDAWLRPEGVRHGFKGGPSGGFVMHHLRRIEAGLRGESLQPETTKELIEKFGEDAVREATGLSLGEVQAAADYGVDYSGRQKEQEVLGFQGPGNDAPVEKAIAQGEDERARRRREKKEKKERKEREKAAKKAGGDSSSPSKKRKFSEEDATSGAAESATADAEHKWMPKEEWEQRQPILEGEIGGREGAPVVRQDGQPPVVVEHDEKGSVKMPEKKKGYTAEEKAARKAAKKARRREELPA